MADNSIEFTSAVAMFDHLETIPSMVSVVGLVKRSDEGSKSFHFSLHGCSSWVSVSAEMVDRFQPLGRAQCDDHHHDVVRLHLKRPDGEHGQLLADLLVQHQTRSFSANFNKLGIIASDDSACGPGTYWDVKARKCLPN